MPLHRRSLIAAALVAAALPATASATLVKTADPVNVAPEPQATMLKQQAPDVAMAADGHFAVAYVEYDSVGTVYVQRFTAGLEKLGERITVAGGPAAGGGVVSGGTSA